MFDRLLSKENHRVQYFGPLHFLAYFNDLTNSLPVNLKLLTDDTFLFSVMRDINKSIIADLAVNPFVPNAPFL